MFKTKKTAIFGAIFINYQIVGVTPIRYWGRRDKQ